MTIIINEDIGLLIERFPRDRKIFILTDRQVYSYYGQGIEGSLDNLDFHMFIMDEGEKNKTKETVFKIYDAMIKSKIDRYDLFVAFGGGVVGDLGGFVASTYMRGMEYVQVPTSLLAQVDSSVGGKTGFDYGGYKNLIGSFKEAELTYINTDYLVSLEERDRISGLGEILKYGLIDDYDFFLNVSSRLDAIYQLDLEVLNYWVIKSIETKMKFVEADFKDLARRRELNFGHTIGHALEALYDFKKYKHGEALILGMIYEARIAHFMGLINEGYLREVTAVLSSLLAPLSFNNEDIARLIGLMEKDKKNSAGNISMILPIGPGRVDFFEKIDSEIIEKVLKGEYIED